MSYDEYSFYLVMAIGFLAAVTLNRGIYLYHKDKYVALEKSETELYSGNPGGVLYAGDDKKELRNQISTSRKTLSIQHFRVSLVGSVLTIIGGHLLRHPIISAGLMLGGVLNIIFSSVMSWGYLEEAEKFSISAVGLFSLIGYVVYKYKS
jgi:hypothetical protein